MMDNDLATPGPCYCACLCTVMAYWDTQMKRNNRNVISYTFVCRNEETNRRVKYLSICLVYKHTKS